MLIKEKIGNLQSFNIGDRSIDRLALEWYEVNKRILHKRTQSGKEVIIKFMNEAQNLTEDDVLWFDETCAIIISVQPCDAICVKPLSMFQMASVCYEIGNKHLPLFYINDELQVPYEKLLFNMLTAAGYEPKKEKRKLLNPLKTTVTPHLNNEGKQSLFSKILQLTTSSSADA